MDKLIVAALLIACASAVTAARSVTVSPGFAYYQDRSPESIAEEIKAAGYDDVRLVCTDNGKVSDDLLKALHDAGIHVWCLTFVNGVYPPADLPKGWESWQMKRRKPGNPDGFVAFCLNNSAYRKWKKKSLVAMLKSHAFYGVDLAEPFLPAYPGPTSELYGCLCDHCAAAFAEMCPGVGGLPDFEDPKSPRYYKTDRALYEKWVGFRVASVVGFLDDLVNGKDGIRENCPNIKVATWSLGLDVPDSLARLREWEAIDGAAIVKRVRPDVHVIQTDWPDWMKPDLSPRYPLKYKPIADSIREAAPKVELVLQTDIGSKPANRRGKAWIEDVEKTAREIGCVMTTHYEYSLGDYIYNDPPAVVRVEPESGGFKLVFNKRLDSISAANIGNYALSTGHVDYAKVDGNIVYLTVSGADGKPEITISGLSDDEARRFHHDKPACTMTETVVRVNAE